MNNIVYFIKFFFSIYFTNEPHLLYKKTCVYGNFAHSGIALKLIFSQETNCIESVDENKNCI